LTNWNGAPISYDLNGNMLSDGANVFTWNARNQVAALNGVSPQYDGFGRRTKNLQNTSFLFGGANAVRELSGSSATANLISGGIDEIFSRADSTGSYTPLKDALGSTIALVDSSGNLVTQYSYDPFGNTIVSGSANSNTSQYTGRENEGNGLYFYRARYYSPLLGRFVSEDPLGFGGGGPNLYAYVGNDPALFDQVAVLYEFTDQRIDLAQAERQLWAVLQITADKAVLGHAHLQGRGTGLIDRSEAVFFGESKNAQDAANRGLTLPLVKLLTELADMRPGFLGTAQQLLCAQRGSPGTILFLNRMPPSFLAPVLAEELSVPGIQQTNMDFTPLHLHLPSDPTRRCAIVGRVDFDTTVQVHRAFSELVIAEGFQRQRQQRRPFFGKHDGHLPLGGAVNARVGATLFPAIQIRLRFLQTPETHAFQRRLLRMADSGFHFAFTIGIAHAAGHGYSSVVR
jgi:RHS repeat-associated protein